MSYFQIRAVLAGGSVMLFGVEAEDLDQARVLAGERLPESGHPVHELTVHPLAAACER